MIRSRSMLLTLALGLLSLLPQSASAGIGDLDPGFGAGGVAHPFPRPQALDKVFPTALRLLPDGRVLVAGQGYLAPGSGTPIRLIRLKRNGALDSSFQHAEARAVISNGVVSDIELLDDGRIVVAASIVVNQQIEFRLIALRGDGTLDRQFGDQGVVKLGEDSTGLQTYSIAVQRPSKILASGYLNGVKTQIKIARFNSDGSVDRSFGDSGYAAVPGTDAGSSLYTYSRTAVATLPSSEIFVGLDTKLPTGVSVPGIAKLSPSGDLIASYGNAGIAAIPNAFRYPISYVAPTAGGDVGFVGSQIVTNRGAFITYDGGLLDTRGGFHDPVGSGANAIRVAGLAALSEHGFAVGGADSIRAMSATGALDPSFGVDGTTSPLLKDCGQWGALDVGSDGEVVAVALDCRELALVRLRGRKGGAAAPRVLITQPPKPIYRRKSTTQYMVITGLAGPANEIDRVEIAIRRYLGGKRCQWFVKGGAKRITLRKRNGECDHHRYMRASVARSGKWRLDMRKALAAGEYQLYARAVTKRGLKSPVIQRPESFARFNVMMPSRP